MNTATSAISKRQQRNIDRASKFRNKLAEDRKMLFKIKELCIERKVTLALSGKRYLRSRYCEVVNMFDGTKTNQFTMVEFENPTRATYTLDHLHSFGMQDLYDQIGVRCVCKFIMQTEGDRVQLYLTCMTSPSSRRKHLSFEKEGTHGVDNNTTSGISDGTSSVGEKAERHPATGSIIERSFNGRTVKDFVIVKSTGIQANGIEDCSPSLVEKDVNRSTDSSSDVTSDKDVNITSGSSPPCSDDKDVNTSSGSSPQCSAASTSTVRTEVTLGNVGHHIHRSMQMARLKEPLIFSAVRRYLAFYRHNKDFGFKGETKISLECQLKSNGFDLPNLEELYFETFSTDYSVDELKNDLSQVKSMLWTERLLHLDRARQASQSFMQPGRIRIIPGHEQYTTSPGKCDPESCTLM